MSIIDKELEAGPHEANFLKLDCARIKKELGWKPRWNAKEMVAKTVEWTYAYMQGEDVDKVMQRQIEEYIIVSSKRKDRKEEE